MYVWKLLGTIYPCEDIHFIGAFCYLELFRDSKHEGMAITNLMAPRLSMLLYS